MKEREQELDAEHEQHAKCKARLYDLDLAQPLLKRDNAALGQRLEAAEQELSTCRRTLSAVEPKLARAEPEVERLRAESEQLRQERVDMLRELGELRPLRAMLEELSREIQSVNEVTDRGEEEEGQPCAASAQHRWTRSQPSVGAADASTSGGGSTARSTAMMMSYSQKHSLWIGLPTIRTVNPALYDNIRSMALDMQKVEAICSDLSRQLEQQHNEATVASRTYELKLSAATQQLESTQAMLSKVNDNLEATQDDLSSSREAVVAIDQIKIVLKSFPGSIAELLASLPAHSSFSSSSSGTTSHRYIASSSNSTNSSTSVFEESKQSASSSSSSHSPLKPSNHMIGTASTTPSKLSAEDQAINNVSNERCRSFAGSRCRICTEFVEILSM